ncbi:MAG TPA: hypothetical protein VM487_25820 [Phycisphaerae bacterium]|nr:hypothetical protein [Phycisphaerae bacterium]
MAYSEIPQLVSKISETTLTTALLYKLAYLSSDGYALVPTSGAGFTTGQREAPFGVYYGGGGLTTSTETEAITIGIGGILKLKMSSDSTMVPGDWISASSAGFGKVATTSEFIVGRLIDFTTGGERNVGSVLWSPIPHIGWPKAFVTSTANT